MRISMYLKVLASKACYGARNIVPSSNLSMAWGPEDHEGHWVRVEGVPEEDPALVSCGRHRALPHTRVKLR